MHSLVNNFRSSSVRGKVRVVFGVGAGAEVVVVAVDQDEAVDSTDAYLVVCSGVRIGGGGGFDVGEGERKGVLSMVGEEEGLSAGFLVGGSSEVMRLGLVSADGGEDSLMTELGTRGVAACMLSLRSFEYVVER